MARSAAQTTAPPARVTDELKWDLLRDEWELLLTIGAGPTLIDDASRRLGEPVADVLARATLLCEHGLLTEVAPRAYALVEAFYQRQEGMASYLRDLVLRRLEPSSAPIAGLVRDGLGGEDALSQLLRRADDVLFPAVVSAAGVESDRSERYAIYFAVAADCDVPLVDASQPAGQSPEQLPELLVDGLLRVVRSAAIQRNRPELAATARLWFAEMRTDPEVAEQIGGLFESFLIEAPARDRAGAAAYAIFPSGGLGVARG